MKLIFFLIIMVFLPLSGCKLLQIKGEVAGVEIEAQTKEETNKREEKNEKDGKFCPPGQAKKGNC